MARKYHTLVIRDGAPGDPWGIAFGDYDLWSVEEERDSYRQRGWKASEVKIITTDSSRQRVIDAAVAALNEKDR
ncbi:hypothetical protein Lo5R7ANS_04 [Mesorhizobium phage vB_MloP_Lo5R7ANS]|uniref:Uncharacterized protein n=1 Tax=Mesorhizobium phage vB_MloP_Lo5R7ANS TaxID=1527771 RepID=A0A076YNS7_9CAUD|nr:hypothetical protein Lo5R7ANS_04 [Mesorhizobium phage vB_MloP_Lo5R7ANS]AIK68474.1 hypothetical protein Lo5R7ANS_04 [Mesorhizobium phage vB_MloP_Lo5R7ANS]